MSKESEKACLAKKTLTPTRLMEAMSIYLPLSLQARLKNILNFGSFTPHQSLDKETSEKFDQKLNEMVFTTEESIEKRGLIASGKEVSGEDRSRLLLTESVGFILLNAKRVYTLIKMREDYLKGPFVIILKGYESLTIDPQAENLPEVCLNIALNQLNENEKLGNGSSTCCSGQYVNAQRIA